MSEKTIDSLLAGSVFLRGLASRFPQYLTGDPDAHIKEILSRLQEAFSVKPNENELKAQLRQTRNAAAFVIALADIKNLWPLEKITHTLTTIADACLNAALDWLLVDAHNKNQLQLGDIDNPAKNCGYTVLAMGKHGGFELNFSSDIDLIVLYDPALAPLVEGVEPSTFFVRMTRKLASLLQDITAQGYAYRVDLRLRPDPRATQVALSVEAALVYYESIGQNWERAAMIKARPAAGDLELGKNFLKELHPFIWRKYLDFAAISEVHNLKKQIHAVKGHGEITVLGHNVKLGRGGIREIEFFVQTQQLIAGGRNAALRGISTLAMLDALVEEKWVEEKTRDQLKHAYRFLRKIEHRIQMVNDQQTHQLPTNQEKFEEFAVFAGYRSADELANELRAVLTQVQMHYDSLFKDDGAGEETDLDFSGSDHDPQTIELLAKAGFSQPETVSATIKGWYAGRYRAMRTETALKRLGELLPGLLEALGASGDADAAFAAFDRFLAGLPAGIQLFSLLRANPQFIDLIASILGSAPKLAQELSRRPKILDAVLEPGFFTTLLSRKDLTGEIDSAMPATMPFDEVLDRARVLCREQMFRIGVRTLANTVSSSEAGLAYSQLASALISRLLALVQLEIESKYGLVEEGKVAVVAMGKLGGREMTAASDLDLILIYDHSADAISSDGPKQLSTNQYFARLTQRLITSITAPTAEGVLYEVDMRLRPSGNKGPIATHISAFMEYQANSAWTWEKMALTRARVIAGDKALCQKVEATIAASLCQQRDAEKVFNDAFEMRQTILGAKVPKGVWDIKNNPGGMIDVEFVVQALQIVHAHAMPQVLSTNICKGLNRLSKAGILDLETGNQLLHFYQLYQQLDQVLKLGVSGVFKSENAPAGLAALIAHATATPDLAGAGELVSDAQKSIKEIFTRIIERPAFT